MDIKKTIIIGIIIYGAMAALNGLLHLGPSAPEPIVVYRGPHPTFQKKPVGDVVRKNYLVPGMGFEESVFYIGDQEIAKQKIINGKIVESSGKIPDGKVKFSDEYHNT